MNSDRQRLLEEFADLLLRVDDWRGRQGGPGTYDETGPLVTALTEILEASGLSEVIRHRVYAEARDRDEDALPDAASLRDGRGLLRALARLLYDLAPVLIDPVPAGLLISDTFERLEGRGPIIRGKGNTRPKFLLKAAQRRSVLTAHYLSRRDQTSWNVEHARIAPLLSEDGRPEWNKAVAAEDRELARSAGLKRGMQLPLSAGERAMEESILLQSVEEQRTVLAKLLAGGKIA